MCKRYKGKDFYCKVYNEHFKGQIDKHDIKIKDIAEVLHITEGYASELVCEDKEKKRIEKKYLDSLAHLLQCSSDYLLDPDITEVYGTSKTGGQAISFEPFLKERDILIEYFSHLREYRPDDNDTCQWDNPDFSLHTESDVTYTYPASFLDDLIYFFKMTSSKSQKIVAQAFRNALQEVENEDVEDLYEKKMKIINDHVEL